MKTRLLIVACVALCVLLAVKPRRVNAQAPLSFFTIAFIPDIHYDFLDGSANIIDQNYWNNGVRPWLLAHINDSTVNLRGAIGLGDMVSENNGVSPSDWTLMMGHFQGFWDAGLPTAVAPGNHDTVIPAEAAWDTTWGPKIKSWLTAFPTKMVLAADDFFPLYPSGAYTPAATTQYVKVDVPTTRGTIKVALTTGSMFTSAAALGQIKALADADTQRNVLFGTHMFLGATFTAPVTDGDQPCVSGTSLCTTSGNFNQQLTGAEMWNLMKTWPRLVGIANGHLHGESGNDGVHSALLTGNAGNKVQAVSSHAINPRGNIYLAKFRLDNNTIEWRSWNTCTNYPTCTTEALDPAAWGTLVVPWTPIIASTGASGFTGKFTGKR